MIFIVEQQKQFLKTKDKDYWCAFPYQEANRIYKCLYLLSEDNLKHISEIHFLIDDSTNIQFYKKCFNKYVADIKEYKDDKKILHELLHDFPDLDEIENDWKKCYVQKLINDIQILSCNSKREIKEYIEDEKKNKATLLFYLPYCKITSSNIIEEFEKTQIKLFSDLFSLHGTSRSEIIFIEPMKYLELRAKLLSLQPVIEKQEKELNNFLNKEYLEYFDKDLLNKVLELRAKKAKVFLHGEDRFITNIIIDKILFNSEYYRYYLPGDLSYIENKQKSMVVYNFESLESNEDYKRIYDRLKDSIEFKIVFQALRKINLKYFDHFESLSIPDIEKWQQHITNIFLSILLENKIYVGSKRQLGSFAGNVLKQLFPSFNSLELLNNAMCNLRSVDYLDIKSNVGLWCYLDHLLTQQISNKPEKVDFKQKVIFENTGKFWEINGLGKRLTCDKIGVLYLCILILNTKNERPPIDSLSIREMSNKYYGREIIVDKTKDQYSKMETARKTISSAMTELRKIKQLEPFINQHFSFSITNNYFDDRNKIEIEVVDPNLKQLVIEN